MLKIMRQKRSRFDCSRIGAPVDFLDWRATGANGAQNDAPVALAKAKLTGAVLAPVLALAQNWRIRFSEGIWRLVPREIWQYRPCQNHNPWCKNSDLATTACVLCVGWMVPWLVARTKSKQEQKAQQHVTEFHGCETYLPRFFNNRTREIEPLFPRYLFIAQPPDGLWWFLRSTIGIIGLVMNGDSPDMMKDKIVDQLRSSEDQRGLVHLEPLELKPGRSRVRCVGGAMIGQTGIYLGRSKRERCAVLFSLLGCERSVDVPLEYVRLA